MPCAAQMNGGKFPVNEINTSIISFRKYEDKLRYLVDSCSWESRVGKKIEIFWAHVENGQDLFGHVYEYFLDCDNIRLIYWSPNGREPYPIVDFMIEDLEEESDFVPVKRRHLKNKKKYKHLLNKE